MPRKIALRLKRLPRSACSPIAPIGCAARAALAALACCALIAPEREAQAGGISATRFGADHGTPAMSNPYAVYYNPAALAGAEGTHLQLDGLVAVRSIEYIRSDAALTPSDPAIGNNAAYKSANTGNATLLNVLASPFFGMATDLGTKALRLGFASYVPFGGQAQWDQSSSAPAKAPGAIDGPQRWHAISGRVQALYNTVALAYRFERARFSVGASASLVLHSIKSLRARNLDGSDDPFDVNGALVEGRSLLEVSGTNVAAGVGVFWEPTRDRKLRLGLSYNSQPGFGQMRLSGQLRQQFGGISQKAGPVPVDFLQTYPDVVRLGGAYRVSQETELRADLTYERWSVMKHQCVVEPGGTCEVGADGSDASGGKIILNLPRKWKDTVSARVGGAYWVEKDTEVFGSGGFGTAAVPKSTIDAAYLDSFTLFFTLGVRHRFTRSVAAAVSYNYVYYLPVDSTGQSQLASFVQPSRSPGSDGTFNAQLYFFNANMTFSF